MAAEPIYFYPGNNLALIVTLRDIDEDTGRLVPLLTGAVETYLASDIQGEVQMHASLVGTVTHLVRGLWLVQYTGATFDRTLLDSLLVDGDPAYLIIKLPSSVLAYTTLTYKTARPMEVTR
jgi:hypothetical protein